MFAVLKSMLGSLPFVDGMLSRYRAWNGRIKPGHFYSPVPSEAEVEQLASRAFEHRPRTFPGIDLCAAEQLSLLKELAPFAADQPFGDDPRPGVRYFFRNGYFSHGDALLLHGLLRLKRPGRVIEIGSGFSSFVMLDTNERFLGRQTRLTFIDPNPERLLSRLLPEDQATAEIVTKPVQEFPIERFSELTGGDILFVDSSHVSKLGSDLNHILFEIVPRLASGVLVHFHDIFYPFEYPPEWFADGRYWNEAYLLRAFLQFNRDFAICAWLDYLGTFHAAELAASIPLAMRNVSTSCPDDFAPSGSLWLRRV